jgi:SAM-dependent methyltransferase
LKVEEMAGLKSTESPFAHLASDYDGWFEEDGRLVFPIEVRAFEKILPSLPKPWLEVGTGSGRFAQALKIEEGLDPSIELLDIAKNRGIDVFLGRGEETPFVDGAFGTVFIIVTLCFVDLPLEVLREANRLLKRSGKVVLGLVLRESPWGQFYQMKKEGGHRFYKYATFYSHDEVTGLLEQAGFSIERVISTLFQEPGRVEHMESPREGHISGAGFTVMLAGKNSKSRKE